MQNAQHSQPSHNNFFLPFLLAAIGLMALTTGYTIGYYVGSEQRNDVLSKNPNSYKDTPTSAPNLSGDIACTEDARVCPDGSTVVRTAPSCEFATCPQNKDNAVYE